MWKTAICYIEVQKPVPGKWTEWTYCKVWYVHLEVGMIGQVGIFRQVTTQVQKQGKQFQMAWKDAHKQWLLNLCNTYMNTLIISSFVLSNQSLKCAHSKYTFYVDQTIGCFCYCSAQKQTESLPIEKVHALCIGN